VLDETPLELIDVILAELEEVVGAADALRREPQRNNGNRDKATYGWADYFVSR